MILVSFLDQSMNRLPQRRSLITDTAEILREEIHAGAWRDVLPGERELASRLAVSRPTLRAALELLRREGCVEVTQGQRRRIRQRNEGRKRSNVVVLVTPTPMHQLPPFVMYWVDELRDCLAHEQFELQLRVTDAFHNARPQRLLQQLVKETPSAAWVLLRSSEPMQKWFYDNNVPCLIAGSCFPGIPLPSIDIDARAVCRHAATLLRNRGHRRIALLLPDSETAGDQASEAGVMEGSTSNAGAAVAIVVRHDGTVAAICRKLEKLLSGENPVTALIVARSSHALTAISFLQQRKFKLPQDCAVISRDNDAFLEFVVPSVARYACDPGLFARRVSRLVLRLAKEGAIAPRQTLLLPQLIKGETAGL